MPESQPFVTSVNAIAEELLDRARSHGSHRASRSLIPGKEHQLRQTLIALADGAELAEHEAPGEATLHVLSGRVGLTADGETTDLRAGDLAQIPLTRHSLRAQADTVLLLTAIPREFEGE